MLPRNMPDIVATTVALLDGIACAVLALHAGHGPIVGWFGWVPKTGVVLGIAFAADGASATIATLVCLLFAASFIFSWGYFEKISAHFQVLTTLFLAARSASR